jgi:hypothetical protein
MKLVFKNDVNIDVSSVLEKDFASGFSYPSSIVNFFKERTKFKCFTGSTCQANAISWNEFKSNAGTFKLNAKHLKIDEENIKKVVLDLNKSDVHTPDLEKELD